VKKGVDSHLSKWHIYLALFLYKFFISNLFASFICSVSASASASAAVNEGASVSRVVNTYKCQIYLILFVYKFFIYNIFACFICSASGVANEGPSASERGGGRQPIGRRRGRGRLVAWFGL
jgi:hypothetical protein